MTADYRFATEADRQALARLVNSAYRGPGGWTSERELLRGPRLEAGAIPLEGTLCFPAAGPIVACVHLERREKYAYLGMLSVEPTQQGRGWASRVLRRAEQFVAEVWKLPEVRMTVIGQRSELIAFYERRGYRRVGERQPFPYADPTLGIPLRSDLYFEVLAKPLNPLSE